MSKWYPVNKPLRDFISEIVVGMVIEVQEMDGLKQYLIGDMNDVGGLCDCCNRDNDTEIVTRYRNINWRTP